MWWCLVFSYVCAALRFTPLSVGSVVSSGLYIESTWLPTKPFNQPAAADLLCILVLLLQYIVHVQCASWLLVLNQINWGGADVFSRLLDFYVTVFAHSASFLRLNIIKYIIHNLHLDYNQAELFWSKKLFLFVVWLYSGIRCFLLRLNGRGDIDTVKKMLMTLEEITFYKAWTMIR